jgi:hypothetical protein
MQMAEQTGKALFRAMREAAERRLERDHPCLVALDNTAKDGSPDTIQTAQKALAALDPDALNVLMADTHKALREYPRSILGAWPISGIRH